MYSNDYQLWCNYNNDCPESDTLFYAFFEDSLNQFIGANSIGTSPVIKQKQAQPENNAANSQVDALLVTDK